MSGNTLWYLVIFKGIPGENQYFRVFIDLANCVAGSSVGGPAKVPLFLPLFAGMVSGSSVGQYGNHRFPLPSR
ncbi:MAG: hypothetical protein ACLSE4_11870 [Clostridium sp.]